MPTHILRLLSRNNNLKSLTNLTQIRRLKEFPGLNYNNELPVDYVILMPEKLDDSPDNNETLRIPKLNEPETDFRKLTVESVFKGFSSALCNFENFLADTESGLIEFDPNNLESFFRILEMKLYPLDTAFYNMTLMRNVKSKEFDHKEFNYLQNRYFRAKDRRFKGKFLDFLREYSMRTNNAKQSDTNAKMLSFYNVLGRSVRSLKAEEIGTLNMHKDHLKNAGISFMMNLVHANEAFNHTVDDPDIIASVSSELEDCQGLHHKERTPLEITASTYDRFMQLCPDRFVRQTLWENYNKRASPKGLPKQNNFNFIQNLRVHKRTIADLSNYRNNLEMRLANNMAESRRQILDALKNLNEENQGVMFERLQELNEFAMGNSFDDPDRLGIQEYDVEYWKHKYTHDIFIGKSELELKAFFPLDKVMQGIHEYFKNYYDIDIVSDEHGSKYLWDRGVHLFEIRRNDQICGKMIYDPLDRSEKNQKEPNHINVRGRNNDINTKPMRLASTSFKIDPEKGKPYLSVPEITSLVYLYAVTIQRLLYNYNYYELNLYGAIETEASELFPNLCIAHLTTDYRILQSFSVRGKSKQIDSELASRICKSISYFKPLNRWQALFKAHLDVEANSNMRSIDTLVKELYPIYSPFPRYKDNYDYCSFTNMFVGPQDGLMYAGLWSKMMANFCLAESIPAELRDKSIPVDAKELRGFNIRLLDELFDPERLDTSKKLLSLTGRSFEPTETSLGVL